MKRSVFYSFHFKEDYWRTQQVRNIGSVEGNVLATPNNWETIQRQGDLAIKNWIDSNLQGKSCLIVLVGANTANRKWINYEIQAAWNKGMGVLGININFLKDRYGNQSPVGHNPFQYVNIGNPLYIQRMSNIVHLHEPNSYSTNSKLWYSQIYTNIAEWIEIAIIYRYNYNK